MWPRGGWSRSRPTHAAVHHCWTYPCVCVPVCVWIHVCQYACMSVLVSVSVCDDACVCVYIMYVCWSECMHLFMYSMFVGMCVRVYSIVQYCKQHLQSFFHLNLEILTPQSLFRSRSPSFPLSGCEWSDCRLRTGKILEDTRRS